jgi:hypothetical protein
LARVLRETGGPEHKLVHQFESGATHSRDVGVSKSLGPEKGRGSRNRWFADSLLEEGVSSEPVSGNPKFPASWENTGKFIDFGL